VSDKIRVDEILVDLS